MPKRRKITSYFRRVKRTRSSFRRRRPRRAPYRRRFRRKNRGFRSRRRYRASMARRLGDSYQRQFYRTNVTDWFTLKANSDHFDTFGWHWHNLALPSTETMFRNATVNYEQFKIMSVCHHFWISDQGDQYANNSTCIEMWQLYDPDDRAIPNSVVNLNAACNTKFKRINYNKHYRQKLKPLWGTTQKSKDGTRDVTVWRGRRHDNPWFDTSDANQAMELANDDKFPLSENGYKMAFYNPTATQGTETPSVVFRHYLTFFVCFRKFKRNNQV